MSSALVGLAILVGALLAGFALRGRYLHAVALARLEASRPVIEAAPSRADAHEGGPLRLAITRRRAAPWAIALLVGLGLALSGLLRAHFALATAIVLGTVGSLVESIAYQRRTRALETQLTDSLDLMVGALRAGAGLLDALESAARETRAPLRPLLEDLCGRIRLGDSPQGVFLDLAEQVPLESYQVLAFTLAVHWEVGGSLAPTLSSTGRSIRDRIELDRRIAAQATQARVSAVVFMGLTLFVGLLVWRGNPPRMEAFLATALGGGLVAAAVIAQCVGVVWMSRLSKFEV